jgi:hypothetical protein
MTSTTEIRMTTRQTKKDYKAMYKSQKREARLLGESLQEASTIVQSLLEDVKAKNEELATAEIVVNCLKRLLREKKNNNIFNNVQSSCKPLYRL